MERHAFEALLNGILKPELVKDYCPNGLQVQGKDTVGKIVTGVTASQALIDKAIELSADTIIVHHGYFWKNEDYVITGMKHNRIKSLISNDINLFAYHLPLDVHPQHGNNVQLANVLEIDVDGSIEPDNYACVVLKGVLRSPMEGTLLNQLISEKLSRQCLHIAGHSNREINTVAWCTGGGQGFIEQAALHGIDAFISGEASEQTTHIAREMDIHYFAAGHHATERYGIKALTEYLVSEYGFDATFVDIDNPV